MNEETGKWIIAAGVLIVIAGILIYFFHDKMHWLGKLPGDIRIDNGNSKIFIPITTMLLLSLLLTIVVNLFKKL